MNVLPLDRPVSLNILRSLLVLLCLGCNIEPTSDYEEADTGAVSFVDVAEEMGLNFQNISGSTEQRYMAESASGGAAFLDYDNDGYQDLFVVNGTRFDDPPPQAVNRLFHNETADPAGGRVFRDTGANLGLPGWGMGCAVGDIDNDGDPDVLATYLGPNRFYRNEGSGRFHEAAYQAGVADPGWGSSAAFGDLDGDGFLDLYVVNYVEFDVDNPERHGSGCPYKGHPVFCGPGGFVPQQDRLFANAGNGRFVDKSSVAGMDQHAYPGLGVTFADLDLDGDLDIYVANDTAPNLLFRNDGDWQFEELGLQGGVAFSGDGKGQAGMGVHSGDFDNDGQLDLFVTNFSDDVNTLYRNQGDMRFADATYQSGLGGVVVPYLGWGTGFFDYDNDGWLDLFVANGHLYPQLTKFVHGLQYAQRNLLYHNEGGRFAEVGSQAGPGWALEKVSRAAAVGDVDNDGDSDLLILNLNEQPSLLRNEGGNRNNWLGLKLIGLQSNRDAVGARVQIKLGEVQLMRELHTGYGFQSAHDGRLLIGLDTTAIVDEVQIFWPSGRLQVLKQPPTRQYLIIREGSSVFAVMESGPSDGTSHAQKHGRKQVSAPSEDRPQMSQPDWSAKNFVRLGRQLFDQGRYDEATGLLEEGLRRHPGSLALRVNLGVQYILGVGRYAEAVAVLSKAVETNPKSVDAHYYLGRARMLLDQPEEAMRSFRRVLALNPSRWEYYNWLGMAYVRVDSLVAAAGTLRRAAARAPWEPNPHLQLAQLYDELGNAKAAEIEQQSFERFFPLKKEVKKFKSKVKALPNDPVAHIELATAYGQQGRRSESLRHFRRSVKLNPKLSAGQLGLGAGLLDQGDLPGAVSALEAAVELEPRSIKAHQILGNAYARQGRWDRAIQSWEVVLQIEPDHPEAAGWIKRARERL